MAKLHELVKIGRYEDAFLVDYLRLQAALANDLAELSDDPAWRRKCLRFRVDLARGFNQYHDNRSLIASQPPVFPFITHAELLAAEIDFLRAGGDLRRTLSRRSLDPPSICTRRTRPSADGRRPARTRSRSTSRRRRM